MPTEDYSPNFMQAGARASGPPAALQLAAAAAAGAARGGQLGAREPAGSMAQLTAYAKRDDFLTLFWLTFLFLQT
jgi:hypothetical protein